MKLKRQLNSWLNGFVSRIESTRIDNTEIFVWISMVTSRVSYRSERMPHWKLGSVLQNNTKLRDGGAIAIRPWKLFLVGSLGRGLAVVRREEAAAKTLSVIKRANSARETGTWGERDRTWHLRRRWGEFRKLK